MSRFELGGGLHVRAKESWVQEYAAMECIGVEVVLSRVGIQKEMDAACNFGLCVPLQQHELRSFDYDREWTCSDWRREVLGGNPVRLGGMQITGEIAPTP